VKSVAAGDLNQSGRPLRRFNPESRISNPNTFVSRHDATTPRIPNACPPLSLSPDVERSEIPARRGPLPLSPSAISALLGNFTSMDHAKGMGQYIVNLLMAVK
jgi:hypothetical protein